MTRHKFNAGLIFLILLSASVAASVPADDDPAPGWLTTSSKAASPQYPKEVPAVVLHNEQIVNVDSTGLMTVTTMRSVRLLTRDGRSSANAGALYLRSSSKVKEIRAWIIRPNGTVKFFGKDSVVDSISDPDDIYDEYRVKSIDASDESDVGTVFGYETVVEEKPLFTQDRWEFQRRLPTLFSRYTLNLPGGWEAKSVTFNRPEIKPSVAGNSQTWELRDLPPIRPEPDSLSVGNLAPRIVINYYPAAKSAGVYNSWTDVSKWYTDLSESALTIDDDIAAKARDLTANETTELGKIQRIGEFVQSMRYISLDIGIARGGGHRPRPANTVLQRGFGDCKDKANLMRAMLKSLKIDSYLVLIFSGDPTYVREEWASPAQFNHCIIAVKVSSATTAPTVMDHPALGRLVIFDATDPYTQVGDLPDHEQGSMALIAAGEQGGLVRMPILSPDANLVERTAEVELSEVGSVSGKISQSSFGQSAAFERGRLRELSAPDYSKSMDRWLAGRIPRGTVLKSSPVEKNSKGAFGLEIEFDAPAYGQVMQNRLLVFKPAMVGRLDQFTPVEGKRETPILIDASAYRESIRIKLPAGFVVDEMPDASKVETAFGTYSSELKLDSGFLSLERRMVLKRTIVPPSGYGEVKDFFDVVRNAEQAPVVLIRK